MAPVPTDSEPIDKPDPNAPHIILRTLPSLSFSTPTHSIHVQLAFQRPLRNKILDMDDAASDSVSVASSNQPHGLRITPPRITPPSGYSRRSQSPVSVDSNFVERVHAAVTGDNNILAPLMIRMNQMEEHAKEMEKHAKGMKDHAEQYEKDKAESDKRLKELEDQVGGLRSDVDKLQDQVKRVRKATRGLKRDVKGLDESVKGLGGGIAAINDTLRQLVANMGSPIPVPQPSPAAPALQAPSSPTAGPSSTSRPLSEASSSGASLSESSSSETSASAQSAPVEIHPPSINSGSIPDFVHSDPESPTDLLPLSEPPSPSNASPYLSPVDPSSPGGVMYTQGSHSSRSLQSQVSTSSQKSSRLRDIARTIKRSLTRRPQNAPDVPSLPPSPQAEPVAGPSTEPQAQGSRRQKLKVLVGAPIVDNRNRE